MFAAWRIIRRQTFRTFAVAALSIGGTADFAAAGQVELVSGTQAGGASVVSTGVSWVRALSADGRFVLFHSDAPNLVPGQNDVNDTANGLGDYDVFLHDRTSKLKTLISHSTGSRNTTANGTSEALALSADGRYALFLSKATDLVPGQDDLNNGQDVFLFDRSTGTTTLVSHDAASPHTAANGLSFSARISANGRYIAFASRATDLVPGQIDDDSTTDIFLYDRVSAKTVLVSHSAGSPKKATGGSGPVNYVLSADGRFLAFASTGKDLVAGQISSPSQFANQNMFLFDRVSGTSLLVNHLPSSPTTAGNGISSRPRISADGRYVAFATDGDNLGAGQGIYLFDRLSGDLKRVGPYGGLEMSADGRFIAFSTFAPNVIPRQSDSNQTGDVFLFDRLSGITTLISHGRRLITTGNRDSGTHGLSVSADGSFIGFTSLATNLIPGFISSPGLTYINVFLYRRGTGTTELVSRDRKLPLRSGNGDSVGPLLSANGQFAVFGSVATNLTSGPQNHFMGAFLYNRNAQSTAQPSVNPDSE